MGIDDSLINEGSVEQVNKADDLLKAYANHRLIRERAVYVYLANSQYLKASSSAEVLVQGSFNSYPWRSYAACAHYLRGQTDKARQHTTVMKLKSPHSALGKLYIALVDWDITIQIKLPPLTLAESAFLTSHLIEHQPAFIERLGKKNYYYLCGTVLGGGITPHPNWGEETWEKDLGEFTAFLSKARDVCRSPRPPVREWNGHI